MIRRSILIIILATLVVSLSGCSGGEQATHPLIKAINDQMAVRRDVEIYASGKRQGKEVTITVTLHNRGQKPITSVQSWLSYDPKQLKGKSIKTDSSPFALTAPYENEFDDKNGVVRIGRATNKPIAEARIDVATVTFEALTDDLIMITFYDYQEVGVGHTSVNMLVNNTPYNVLKQPNVPAVVIPKNQ